MNNFKPSVKKLMVINSFYIEKENHSNKIESLSKDWEVSKNEVVRTILDLGLGELKRLEEQ